MIISVSKIYNIQSDGIYEDVIIKKNDNTYQLHPIAYLWLESQNKLSLIDKVMRLFDFNFQRVIDTYPLEKIQNHYLESCRYFFDKFKVDEENIAYIKSLSLLIEYLLSGSEYTIEETINRSLDYNLKENEEYMKAIKKIITLHIEFLATEYIDEENRKG